MALGPNPCMPGRIRNSRQSAEGFKAEDKASQPNMKEALGQCLVSMPRAGLVSKV